MNPDLISLLAPTELAGIAARLPIVFLVDAKSNPTPRLRRGVRL
jgi:hypothetical protein